MLAVEAHRVRHDDRRGAGDRNEANLEILLLRRAGLREDLARRLERKELRERGKRGRGADRLEKYAAGAVLRKYGAHHGRGDDAPVALLFALDRSLDGSALELRRLLLLGLAAVAPADASRSIELALGIEGVLEGGHGGALHPCAGAPAGIAGELAMAIPIYGFCATSAADLRRHVRTCSGEARQRRQVYAVCASLTASRA